MHPRGREILGSITGARALLAADGQAAAGISTCLRRWAKCVGRYARIPEFATHSAS